MILNSVTTLKTSKPTDAVVLLFVEPISLPIVSIVLETRPEMMDRIRQITEWHRKWFKFHREIIVSNCDPCIPGVTFIQCLNMPLKEKILHWYSEFCIKWLNRLCDAPFVLIWQWDGFIINPELWTNEFLEYDYIGAPAISHWHKLSSQLEIMNPNWKKPFKDGTPIVGNGGFSLRSKRFLETTEKLSPACYPTLVEWEDAYLCVEKRKELEGMDIKFCPVGLASRFSVEAEDSRTLEGCFGFHGGGLLPKVKALLESKYTIKGEVK